MADTGAPWNIPFAEPTDLVRDWPDLSEDVANAVAAGLDAAGGLVAVKFVTRTTPFTVSLAEGASAVVDDVEIVHAVADEDHVVYLFGQLTGSGVEANASLAGFITAGGTTVGGGTVEGSRTSVGGGAFSGDNGVLNSVFMVARHAPNSTASITYDVRVFNQFNGTQNVVVNRTGTDTNAARFGRTATSLLLLEVKV